MSWYTVMTAMEDVNTQRLGLATVLYNVGFHRHRKQDIEFLLNSTFLSESLPIRYASMHFCYDDIRLLPLISAMQLITGKEARIRFRSHYGTEIQTKLLFGCIPLFTTSNATPFCYFLT
jgi:hypothetical protein